MIDVLLPEPGPYRILDTIPQLGIWYLPPLGDHGSDSQSCTATINQEKALDMVKKSQPNMSEMQHENYVHNEDFLQSFFLNWKTQGASLKCPVGQ